MLAQLLRVELQHANNKGIWGVMYLLMFPKGSSPGGSRRHIQHLVDATCDTKAPAAHECFVEVTRWLNLLLGGKVHRLLASWLCGAPITALNKKNLDGFRPIAVDETSDDW